MLEPRAAPDDLLDFVELPIFTKRWAGLGLDDERELFALQLMLMADPTSGHVIQGTHGIRKFRYAPLAWERGKRGATRVLYVYFPVSRLILLCLVYGKGEVATISQAVKRQLNVLVDEIAAELEKRESL